MSRESRKVVFINHLDETFTPTASGALSTYIWECCRAAERAECRPWVVTRPSTQPMWDWPQILVVTPPRSPVWTRWHILVRVYRRVTALPRVGQRRWVRKIA